MDSGTEPSTRYLLTSSNYAMWKLPMTAKLQDIGIREFVTGIYKIDEKTSAEEIDRLGKLNVRAYSMIIQNLDTDNLGFVSTTMPPEDEFNGRALWVLLQKKYAGSDLVARSTALDSFLDLEYDNVASFSKSIRLANQKLVLAGVKLDDQVKIMIMLKKLPQADFRSFRDIVAMGFSAETFESIVKRLESYVVSNNLSKTSLQDPPATMYTKSSTGLKAAESSSSTSSICPHCKKSGHRATNCWVKYPEKAPKTHSAHLTVVDEYNQLQSVTNWCTLPDGTRFDADEITYDNVRYTM